MIIKSNVPLRCYKCHGMKYIGEPYHAFETWYVDVTCMICSDSKDIEIDKLKKLLEDLEKYVVINKSITKL